MAKTLVLKDCNFTVNKLDTVTIIDEAIPCTAIELDQSTTTITTLGGTVTLEATVTPVDTTDVVVWSSSDPDVATVSNGVVTTTGVGKVTITATCGSYSDTCEITARATLSGTTNLAGGYIADNAASTGGNGRTTISNTAGRGSMVASSGDKPFYSSYDGGTYYPITLPKGATQITYTMSDQSNVHMRLFSFYGDNTEIQTSYCIAVSETLEDYATKTITIPDPAGYPDIDSFSVSLKRVGGDKIFKAEDFATAQIVILGDES